MSASFGITLDPWQENVLQAAMGERHDGTWAARQVALSTPRQNGKSQLIVVRALAGILLFGEETIIISAHQLDTAREIFHRLSDLVEQFPGLKNRVHSVIRSFNREYIQFTSGQIIKFKARAKDTGRGFSCDCLLLDEAQILDADSWATILPTMSARPNPQAWLLGTPPGEGDEGEVFTRIRMIGIEGKEPRIAYLEWAADPDDPIDDPATWAKANPSYGTRIEHEAIATELASMSDAQFRSERLGIWSEAASGQPVVKARLWADLRDDGPAYDAAPGCLAVDMSHDRRISVAACWVTGDVAHVEEVWAGEDVMAVLDWVTARAGRRMPVLIDGVSQASALIPELKARRVAVRQSTAGDMAKGCAMFEQRCQAGTLTHAGQRRLDDAVEGGRKRLIRDAGGWGWNRSNPSVSIHPVVAASLALLGATEAAKPQRKRREAIVL